MKKIVLLLVTLGFYYGLSAQEEKIRIEPDPRLYEFYSPDKLEIYRQEAPSKLLHLNFWLQGTYYINDQVPENSQLLNDIKEYAAMPDLVNISQIIEERALHMFHFSFPMDEEKFNLFPIGESGLYVIVYPFTLIKENEQKYFTRFGL